MPFEDWALFVDAFSGGIAAQPQIRGLDLELIDSALEFGRPGAAAPRRKRMLRTTTLRA
jgi:hypothetical protein